MEEYREAKKGKLQRTLYSGSSAASSKVNKTANKRANEDQSVLPPHKTSKYGNFVSSSSTEETTEKRTEGFVLPPKSCQTPSDNFMNFCDKIVQNSRSEQDRSNVAQSDDNSQSGGFKPNYKRQLEGLRKNFEENLYSQERIRPTLDTSYPLHNFILGFELSRKISSTGRPLIYKISLHEKV